MLHIVFQAILQHNDDNLHFYRWGNWSSEQLNDFTKISLKGFESLSFWCWRVTMLFPLVSSIILYLQFRHLKRSSKNHKMFCLQTLSVKALTWTNDTGYNVHISVSEFNELQTSLVTAFSTITFYYLMLKKKKKAISPRLEYSPYLVEKLKWRGFFLEKPLPARVAQGPTCPSSDPVE